MWRILKVIATTDRGEKPAFNTSCTNQVSKNRKMTVSKRVAEKKVAKFEKNISRRGVGPLSSKTPFEPAHVVLILFAVLVVASFIFQVVRMAMNGGVPEGGVDS